MKTLWIQMLGIAAGLLPTLSWAYPCRAASGSPTQVSASPFDIKVPSDGSSPAGHVAKWSESNTSEAMCSSDKLNSKLELESFYQFGFVNELTAEVGPGGREYILLDEFFGLAFEIYIAGDYKDYVKVTSAGGYTGNKFKSSVTTDSSGNFKLYSIGTGLQGRVFLWIKKPFIGEKKIPLKKLLWAKLQVGKIDGVTVPPYLEISVSGTLRSDASCQFTEQVYAIDFGDLASSSITSVSQLENNQVGKQLTLDLNCSQNIAKLPMTISLVGPSAPTEPDALSTSHPDIGIAVKANNKLVTPMADMASIPTADQQIDTQTNGTQKSATIQAYPVKLADKVSAGEFKSSATLRVDFK